MRERDGRTDGRTEGGGEREREGGREGEKRPHPHTVVALNQLLPYRICSLTTECVLSHPHTVVALNELLS